MTLLASSNPTPRFQRADGSPRRVLYAEDQVTSRIVTKAMLERMGFVVDAVEDGELALQCARNDVYDVILLDIEMPVMDGVTAARSIRAELAHCADTPILALSAFLADSTEHTKWRDAFDSALSKPANTNELMKAMRRAVQVKDERNQKLPAQPSRDDLLVALQGQVPKGVWLRLLGLARDEASHLANVLIAAQAAGDVAVVRQAALAIKSLAANFGAGNLAKLMAQLAENGAPEAETNLPQAIVLWH
jgi:CheY-like chemotaxis protein